MDSPIKLISMTKHEMSILRGASIAGLISSTLIACTSLVYIRFNAFTDPTQTAGGSPRSLPIAGFVVEAVLGSALSLLSAIAIVAWVMRGEVHSSEELSNQKRVIILPLIASGALSLPFRTIAELVGQPSIPDKTMLICADSAAAIGMSVLLFYLWLYPHMCAAGDIVKTESPKRSIVFSPVAIFVGYGCCRIAASIVFSVHLCSFPLQSILCWIGLLVQGIGSKTTTTHTLGLLLIGALDLSVVCFVICTSRIHTRLVSCTFDTSSPQMVVAMRYYFRSAGLLTINAVVLCLLEALWSPLQASIVLDHTGELLLSHEVGHAAVSVAVSTYAAREYFVHHSWRTDAGFSATLKQVFRSFGITSIKVEEELVYRVADERDPLTEYPVPQENTFSLETATLLFNMAWLAADSSNLNIERMSPTHYGRPAFSVFSQTDSDEYQAGVVILESTDRIIIAFKCRGPCRQARQQHLSKTNLGKCIAESTSASDKGAQNVRKIGSRLQGLYRRSKVHVACEQAYTSVRNRVHDDVDILLKRKSRPVYVTGHAAAGSLAHLCAFDLNLRDFKFRGQAVCVYTYGAIKTMNSAMVRLFEVVVPFRWRCLVAGDCVSLQPLSSSFQHASKVATFTRNGHLAIELHRSFKWWQSPVSVHPMHKLSAYFCALLNWHSAFHVRRPIDLWDWPVDKTIKSLFQQETSMRDVKWPVDSALDSPTPDVELRSLRQIDMLHPTTEGDVEDIVAFER